ncbi:hypothetical protein, partial [Pseudomonas prosekii]|uniref:hypothetical protein n=1 Tax=Pseudomonas prosekii TaxID=1148509 RepID=UPI001C7DD5E0
GGGNHHQHEVVSFNRGGDSRGLGGLTPAIKSIGDRWFAQKPVGARLARDDGGSVADDVD